MSWERYHYLTFPTADLWGIVMPGNCPHTKRQSVSVDDLTGPPFILLGARLVQGHTQMVRKQINGQAASGKLFSSRKNLGILVNYITNALT